MEDLYGLNSIYFLHSNILFQCFFDEKIAQRLLKRPIFTRLETSAAYETFHWLQKKSCVFR